MRGRRNPSEDEVIRGLERAAATGDPSAARQLERIRARLDPTDTWKPYWPDVWGDGSEDNDWVINDYYPGHEVELPRDFDDKTLLKILKAEGEIKKTVRLSSLEIDGDEDQINISSRRDGRPELELRRVRARR